MIIFSRYIQADLKLKIKTTRDLLKLQALRSVRNKSFQRDFVFAWNLPFELKKVKLVSFITYILSIEIYQFHHLIFILIYHLIFIYFNLPSHFYKRKNV